MGQFLSFLGTFWAALAKRPKKLPGRFQKFACYIFTAKQICPQNFKEWWGILARHLVKNNPLIKKNQLNVLLKPTNFSKKSERFYIIWFTRTVYKNIEQTVHYTLPLPESTYVLSGHYTTVDYPTTTQLNIRDMTLSMQWGVVLSTAYL